MNRLAVNIVLVLPLVLGVGWFGWQEVKAQGADWLPIKHVRIEGAFQHISKEKMKVLLKNQVNHGLYNADIQQIHQSVYALPWVESVGVKRVWPDTLDIKIIEQVPIVKWKHTGFLNSEGELFKPENRQGFGHLSVLFGPEESEKKLLATMRELNDILAKKDMKIDALIINERRAWSIKLENDMELILGKNGPREKLKRFLKTQHLIGEQQMAQVAIVDLRYPNGYSLAWKPGTEEIDWQAIAEK